MSHMQVKMNLDTLLEAARFVERQDELKQRQQQQQQLHRQIELLGVAQSVISKAVAPLPVSTAPLHAPPPLHHHLGQAQQPGRTGAQQPPSSSPPLSLLKQELTSTLPPPLAPASPSPSPPTATSTAPSNRVINNSFDIINQSVSEDGVEQKRKQPPLAFRSGTREVHNKLEKHRRAHLKECFDLLKRQLPSGADEKKASNLSILHSALCYIQALKRKERELEHEMERLAREKIAHQQRLVVLKKEVAAQCDNVDFSALLAETTTATTVLATPLHQQHHQIAVAGDGLANCRQIATLSAPKTANSTPIVAVTSLPEQKLIRAAPVSSTSTIQRTVVPVNGVVKESNNQMQATALSVVPMGYPVSQGLVLQKVALVPKGLTDLSPLVSSPAVTHFIAAPHQQIGGKMVPLVNAQYVVKPVVVVSTPSRPS